MTSGHTKIKRDQRETPSPFSQISLDMCRFVFILLRLSNVEKSQTISFVDSVYIDSVNSKSQL